MNERIKKFIKKQTCASVCCIDSSGKPYCFSVFFAFDNNKCLLYYKSSNDTKHAHLLRLNPAVAGTILPDKLSKVGIKGIQFEGAVLAFNDNENNNAASVYYGKHPMARTIPGELWTIRIDYIKFTDKSLGFGSKLVWSREELSLFSKYKYLNTFI